MDILQDKNTITMVTQRDNTITMVTRERGSTITTITITITTFRCCRCCCGCRMQTEAAVRFSHRSQPCGCTPAPAGRPLLLRKK